MTPNHSPPQPDLVNIRGVIMFCVLLALLLALIHPIVGAVERIDRRPRPVQDLSPAAQHPGFAAGWQDPTADLAAQRQSENAHLHGYAWIDRRNGIVQIPIDRAMELMSRANTSATQAAMPRGGEP